jgi:choline dehydrogenase-like flavoprotein
VVVGKGIGGSAVQDAMIYVRCTQQDIAGWNISGWTWERVLQAYVAMEDFVPDVPGNIPAHHGTSGERPDISGDNKGGNNNINNGEPQPNPMRRRAEAVAAAGEDDDNEGEEEDPVDLLNGHFRIQTTRPGYVDGVAQRFVAAAVEFGLPLSMDFNDPNGGRAGVGFYSFNIRDGIRDSAAVRMLAPLLFKGGKRRGNSGILDDAHRDPLSINGRTKAAYGEEVGNFLLLTNAEVTRVLFEDDLLLYGAPEPNKNRGAGFGVGGFLSALGSGSIETDKFKISASGSLLASGGGGGGVRGTSRAISVSYQVSICLIYI